MIRPRFSIANLLFLTLVAALAALNYRNRIQVQYLEARLARHEAVRAQALRVQQRQFELRAKTEQMIRQHEIGAVYRWKGSGDSFLATANHFARRTRDATAVWPSGFEFAIPVGVRHERSVVRNAQFKLANEQAILDQLEQELRSRAAKSSTNVSTGSN